ncbi:carbohydrate ABC transporter permease [Leucobacter sp. M11]|uniref:carbohydrate ABC transporter permease n=1 Tax=Leucobacter sp. M11 TaxID=2993565 RepID=UPI002D8081F7|nr:carbohydrate ABC transporter permease [Leucobacter sp. M11]MEB4614485.1 carbohydrate ABC transporter permease [Leucobacter sp. M11]
MTTTETRLLRTQGVAPTAQRRSPIAKILLGVLGVVVALVWVFPVYWMLNSAFLPDAVLQSGRPQFLPVGGSLDNFRAVITGGTFLPALGVSVAVALITVICCLIFAFLAALAISRFRFRGRKSFVIAVLLIQMLPAEGLFIAQYKLMGSVGLLNSVIGVSILYIAAVVPFTIWMLRGFVAGIPVELEEAAMVDGLSRTQAFLRITFPLLAPGLVASGVYAFLQAWNEFTVALVILQDGSTQTLPLWLRGFIQQSSSRAIDWGEVMAASTLVALPVIIFFLVVQGRMTSGLVSGAVKG